MLEVDPTLVRFKYFVSFYSNFWSLGHQMMRTMIPPATTQAPQVCLRRYINISSNTGDDIILTMAPKNISYQQMRRSKIGMSRLKCCSSSADGDIDTRYRLDLHHEIMRMLWDDRLHECPLHQPHQILDIDTGTGIWAIEMADQYPMAEIIGTHLSPIQPEWVPANW